MTESTFFWIVLVTYLAMALLAMAALFLINAPYGRHARSTGFGPTLRSRTGWILMEAPAPLVFVLCFLLGGRTDIVSLVFLGMWLWHYVYRAFVFPFRMRGGDKPMPWLVAGLAVVHNLMNGYLNGRYLFTLGPRYDAAWLLSGRFLLGAALFAAGMWLNRKSDRLLLDLRRPGETGYKIPRGGLFDLVSCPNYLGEIIEWLGWALCTFQPAGLAFALFTVANLVPRAWAHHRFYRQRFPDYPPHRRALIPFWF